MSIGQSKWKVDLNDKTEQPMDVHHGDLFWLQGKPDDSIEKTTVKFCVRDSADNLEREARLLTAWN